MVASRSSARWPWGFLRIAHRGAPEYAPENSLRGFAIAVALGADMVETDVWASADGALVLSHDDHLDLPHPEFPRPVRVTRTPLAALRSLTPGGEPLATFEEALALRHHGAPLTFNVDVKMPGLAAALVRALRATGRREGILLTGHAPHTFAAVRAAEPWVCAALTGAVARRGAPTQAVARGGPWPGGVLLGLQLADAARGVGVGAVTIEHALATVESVRVCHRAGLRVLVWTVDDPLRMRVLRVVGVDGITTNRVDALARCRWGVLS